MQGDAISRQRRLHQGAQSPKYARRSMNAHRTGLSIPLATISL
jgi:hypothetical protein